MYQRILVPVDGSDTANKALVAALQMARESGGRVRLVHVIDALAYLTGYEQNGAYSGELIAALRGAGLKVLDDALAIAQAAGVEADSELRDGLGERLGDTVSQAADAWKADLVVVGTHGRRGLGRLLLGSGAEQILRMARTPVLVIRASVPGGERPAG